MWPVPLRVATWNLFHGRSLPPRHELLIADYAAALAAAPWEVCALQEVPPWWVRPLARACHASARSVRTSLLRATLPQLQREIHADPEVLGVRGAAVNVLLVRSTAGQIGRHRTATLRRAPQRRTMHAVELVRPHGHRWWVANVHSHNRPVTAAERDTALALETLRDWADDQPALLLGDLNLDAQGAARCTRRAEMELLASDRVDHIVGTSGSRLTAPPRATHPRTLDGQARLSDHRLLVAEARLTPAAVDGP